MLRFLLLDQSLLHLLTVLIGMDLDLDLLLVKVIAKILVKRQN